MNDSEAKPWTVTRSEIPEIPLQRCIITASIMGNDAASRSDFCRALELATTMSNNVCCKHVIFASDECLVCMLPTTVGARVGECRGRPPQSESVAGLGVRHDLKASNDSPGRSTHLWTSKNRK